MPMLSITSALREIASARRCEDIAAVFACLSRAEVDSSLARVRPNSSTAPPRAMQPMTGCSRKMTAM